MSACCGASASSWRSVPPTSSGQCRSICRIAG
jgi:hypothetical protein